MNLVATPWTDGADSVDSDESEDESEDDELKFICFKVDEERGYKNMYMLHVPRREEHR